MTLKKLGKETWFYDNLPMHFAETLTFEELEGLSISISTSGFSGLRLECINQIDSDSMIFIFEISRLCFSCIRGLSAVMEICENAPYDHSRIFRM